MVTSAGLSNVYGGYQQARKTDTEIERNDIANETARAAQEGDKAWGNTIPVLQQMLQPGATPMPAGPQMAQAGGAPPAPPPGQASQPMMQPAAPERTVSPQSGGPSVGVYNQGQFNPMDAQASAPPAGAQPQMLGGPSPPGPQAAAPPQAPPAASQQPGAQTQGRLDLHTVMAAVVKANPGAKPNVIAAAVAKALPYMTAQSQMDYKNLMVQLSAGRLNETTAHNAEKEGAARSRIGQGDQKIAQGDRRLDQGDTRLEQQGGEFASRDVRRKDQTRQGDEKIGLAGQREARLAAQAEVRNDQRYQQLDLQKQSLEDRIQKGGDRAALSEWRAIVDAQHKRALEIIQSGKNAIGVMDPKEREALVKEQNDFYKQQIEQMRKGPARPERPAGADTTGAPGKKTEDRPPASGPPGQTPQIFHNKTTGETIQWDGKAWVPVENNRLPANASQTEGRTSPGISFTNDEGISGTMTDEDLRQANLRELALRKLRRAQGVPELQTQYGKDQSREISDAVPRRRQ